MIVKNEEQFIETCINSVKDVVDEIILVDTGSTDKTIEIASAIASSSITSSSIASSSIASSPFVSSNQNLKIFNYEWADDFSAARNFSLSKVTSDWILVLDADEIIAEEDLKKIKYMIQTTALSGFQLLQRTYTNDSEQTLWQKTSPDNPFAHGFFGFVDIPITRLFKNNPLFKFTGRVHEDITPSIKAQKQPMVKSPVVIHHYQYSRGKDFVRDKQLYYLELTLKKTKEQPANPKPYADAGIIYYNYKKDPEKALFYFQKALEIDSTYKQAYNYLAKIFMQQGKKNQAIEILNKSINLRLEDETTYFNLGVIYMQDDKLEDAVGLFNKVLAINPNKLAAYYNIGLILIKLNKFSQAIEVFKKAVSMDPHDTRVYLHLAKLHEKISEPKKAIRYYKQLINLQSNKDNQQKYHQNITNTKHNQQEFLDKIYQLENKLYK